MENSGTEGGGLGWGGAPSGSDNDDRHWTRLSSAAERILPEGPIGRVVAQLRQRGRIADRRARVFLFVLLLTVATGLGYYVGRPLLQSWGEGSARATENQVRESEAASAALDHRREEVKALLVEALKLAPEVIREDRGTDESFHPPTVLSDGALIAAGDMGTILHSQDGGARWETAREAPGAREGFRSPVILSDGALIATGYDGTILRSWDGRAPWEKVREDTSGRGEGLYTPLILADGALISMGFEGSILRSQDGRAPWETVREGSGETFPNPVILDDGALIATGSRGTILRSQDGRAPWEAVHDPTGEAFFSLLLLADGALIAAGEYGTVLRSRDGRAPWENVRERTGERLFDPVLLPDGVVILAGDEGTILRSQDGLAPWETVHDATGDSLSTPVLLPDGALIAMGSRGTILRSDDGNAPWETVREATGEDFSTPVLLPDGELIAIGFKGTILRSRDGRVPWEKSRESVDTGTYFTNDLVLLDDGALIATGSSGTILRLSDVSSRALQELRLAPGAEGDEQLLRHLRPIEPGVRRSPAVIRVEQKHDIIRAERAVVQVTLAAARKRLEDQQSGAAAGEVRREEFAAFLASCRGDAPESAEAAVTIACLAAYEANEEETERQWWTALADQVPPGILLLFLLATLSALYRYNVRLAGFHHSRADALELLAAGVTIGDLTPLADTLAADKVEFGATKTPTDHAAEMATALINRSKP